MRLNSVKLGSVWLFLLVALANLTLANSATPQLIVEVTTDKPAYQAGETVVVEVRTFLDGNPVDATLSRAIVTLTLPGGHTLKSNVHKQFSRVGLGVYSASGVAQAPGSREVEVKAVIKQKVSSCACYHKSYRVQHIKSQGFANYDVQGEALQVGLSANVNSASVCDAFSVRVTLNHEAEIHLLLVLSSGAHRELLIPGWLGQGEHTISFQPNQFDVDAVKLTVVAEDRYGQRAFASVPVSLQRSATACDCL